MAVHASFSLHHLVDLGTAAALKGVALVFVFGLLVVVSDYLDGWRQKRALNGIPIIDEGSYMRPRLRWKTFDAEKEYTRAYHLVCVTFLGAGPFDLLLINGCHGSSIAKTENRMPRGCRTMNMEL